MITAMEWDEDRQIAKVFTSNWDVARSLKKAGYPILKHNAAGWWFEIDVKEMKIWEKPQS